MEEVGRELPLRGHPLLDLRRPQEIENGIPQERMDGCGHVLSFQGRDAHLQFERIRKNGLQTAEETGIHPRPEPLPPPHPAIEGKESVEEFQIGPGL